MKKLFCSCFMATLITFSFAQDKSDYQKRTFIRGIDTLGYRMLFPLNYKPGKKYPVVLFLHGSGERGNDNELQLTHGWKLFADSANRKSYRAFVIFPQCHLNSSWSKPSNEPMTADLSMVAQLMDSMANSGAVNKKRIYIGGLSMGGMGTFNLLWRKPGFFAAGFPICGGGDTSKIKSYGKNFPIWIFHGADDPVVDVNNSRMMVAAFTRAEGKVKYSEYPNVKHDSWNNAFAEPDLLPWLFSQHKRK
jgi:predicted peptidase